MNPNPVAAPRTMTANEFYDFVHRPECAHRRFELVRGEVVELPPLHKRHDDVVAAAARVLGEYSKRRGKGYITTSDTGLLLHRNPDTVRGPDLAVYEDARTWSEFQPKYGQVPPWLAVDVLSSLDKVNRILRMTNEFLRAGVGLVWLLDPEERTAVVFRAGREPMLVEEAGTLTGDDVMNGLTVRVGELFADKAPR